MVIGGGGFTPVTKSRQVKLLLQASVTFQTRVTSCGQVPLVVVLSTRRVEAGLQQVVTGVGASNIQSEPHSTVLLEAQISDRLDGGWFTWNGRTHPLLFPE